MSHGYEHDRWMDARMMGSMGWGGWLVMGVGLVLGLVVLAALVLWLVRTSTRTPVVPAAAATDPPATSEALLVLDGRFARGEIDEDEYLSRRRLVATGPGPARAS